MQYELFYLIVVSKENELDNIKKEVKKIVENAEGKFEEKETYEKRRLSYAVEKESHGIYIAQRFELENTSELAKITAKLNLNNNIARFILSKADDLPELKSKEERINELTKKEELRKDNKQKNEAEKNAKEVKKTASNITQDTSKKEETTPKKKPGKTEETKKETKAIKDNDIDKKLEEILNI